MWKTGQGANWTDLVLSPAPAILIEAERHNDITLRKAEGNRASMKIYLDNCALGRPEDKQVGLVKKQAEAVLDIIEGVRQGRWVMVRSTTHTAEAKAFAADDPVRYAKLIDRLDLSTELPWDSADAYPLYTDLRRAPRGKAPLLKQMDGLHLATAVYSGAAVLVTVDRQLYLWGRAHRALLLGLAVLRPGEFLTRFDHARIRTEKA